jgi:FdhD protein
MNERPAGTIFALNRIGLGVAGDQLIERRLPDEVPIALEYCGLGYAVMMGSPGDLQDFIVGHAIAEGLVAAASEVSGVDAAPVDGGWVVRANLPDSSREAIYARARTRVSDSSCGLCGVDSIAEALRPLPEVTSRVALHRDAITRALNGLSAYQPINFATGAVHAAAFCDAAGNIICAREDVGRHNALDKLIGAMARAGNPVESGFILLTARCSFELVEKTVRSGASMLVTISAPTTLAAQRAIAAGLTLVALARADNALIVNDPGGSIA